MGRPRPDFTFSKLALLSILPREVGKCRPLAESAMIAIMASTTAPFRPPRALAVARAPLAPRLGGLLLLLMRP
jgi:hypothetical protein